MGAPKKLPCPTLQLKYGRVRYRQKNRFVKFTCNQGYIIAGEKYSICENGTWDGPAPKCVRPSCKKVNPPLNGIIYPSHRGGVLNFFCKPGFMLKGSNTSYCDGNKWDNNLPSCIENNVEPPLKCDFEKEDLCGWNHDLRHDFDWKRKNFKTPTGHLGTGPSHDHSKGLNRDGYYMYIESSSRNENDTARLISPVYSVMNESDVCLLFYYHMYGSTTGQLRVYVRKLRESWNLNPKKAIFWRSGNHGDKWIESWTNLGPIDDDFQIIIEGVRGKSYYSDIAVDDINIVPNCQNDTFTTDNNMMYSFDDDLVPSCVNRCDIVLNSTIYPCNCDDTCYDSNTCCLDYIAVCVLGTEEYLGTMDFTTEGFNNMTNTWDVPRTPNIFTETIKRTSRTTTAKPTTTKKTTTTKLTTKRTTSKPTTKTTITTTKATINIVTSTKSMTKATEPLKIVSTQEVEMKQTTNAVLSLSTTELEMDPLLINMVTIPQQRKYSVQTLEVTNIEDTHSHTNIAIAISAVILIIIITLLTYLVTRSKIKCRHLKEVKRSHGDSQSDVRFLTSDEILNFNLAYVDD
ncbi:hypothetical protein FQA39_LY14899 [Lamprigera yunnana]|nr:hypothetical protein FQA39_LY14899 [Lamprigera yunnana]